MDKIYSLYGDKIMRDIREMKIPDKKNPDTLIYGTRKDVFVVPLSKSDVVLPMRYVVTVENGELIVTQPYGQRLGDGYESAVRKFLRDFDKLERLDKTPTLEEMCRKYRVV